MANLTVSQLNSVELLGGGVRMPKVRKTLDDYFKESKLEVGQHINGDEAMALGEGNTINRFRFKRILFLQMIF
jgi:hypoxia up-regulated 1